MAEFPRNQVFRANHQRGLYFKPPERFFSRPND